MPCSRPTQLSAWATCKRGECWLTGDDTCVLPLDAADLLKTQPELMSTAIKLHNRVIRSIKGSCVGYTIEQEGDSFIILFHEPYDAVAFCLQVRV
jgi:hypothetical protein